MARNYKEAAKYEDTPKQVRNREERNRARAELAKEGKVVKGDRKDVDHIKPLSKGGKTEPTNLRVLPQSENRSFQRDGHKWVGPAKSLAMEHISQKNKGGE